MFKIKTGADGNSRYKARLVAQGYSQRYGIDYEETFSPTIPHSVIRLLFALSCKLNWIAYHLDVQTAFLNGDLTETVYLQQPEHFKVKGSEIKVCQLKKAIYGLKQVSRAWNLKANSILNDLDFKKCPHEPCLFTKKINGALVVLALYVDDFFLFSDSVKAADLVASMLEEKVSIRNLGEIREYLGIRVRRSGNCIMLDQSTYIERVIERFNYQNCKPVSSPMERTYLGLSHDPHTGNVLPYQQLIGALMYIAICTRPDIMFTVSLSQFNNNFIKSHWSAACRVLRYLQGTKLNCLTFKRDHQDIQLFCDADWGNAIDRKSYSGVVSVFQGAAIFWRSKKQQSQALSSTEAEYISLCEGAKEAKFSSNLLEFLVGRKGPISICCDNQGARLISLNESSGSRLKHVDIQYHFTRTMVQENVVKITYLNTSEMPADILTKPLPTPKHNFCK